MQAEYFVIKIIDHSFQDAIEYAKSGGFDSYLAIGGGSVMDTCKVANLYASKLDAEFLDYVNAPIGKGLPATHKVRPFIASTSAHVASTPLLNVTVYIYI